MKPTFFIALRHLKSRHSFSYISFISFLSVIGLGIGVAVLVLTLGILNGFEHEIQEKIVSFDGHIRINGYLSNPLPEHSAELDSVLNSIDHIDVRAPYIRHVVMIRHKSKTEGVVIEGIGQESAEKVFGTPALMNKGKFNLGGKEKGLVMGEGLAEKLDAGLSDQVILFDLQRLASSGKSPRITQFTVTGIYSTGLKEYDESIVYVDFNQAQELAGLNNQMTGEILMVDNLDNIAYVANELDEKLNYPYFASTWKERHSTLFEWLNIQKYPITIIFALVVLVAGLNITSSLTMIVMEKGKDIGILRAMGYPLITIRNIFVTEGIIIGISGSVIGLSLALLLGWIQNQYGIIGIPEDVYFMNKLPIKLSLTQFLWVGGITLLLAVLSTGYPVQRASKVKPAHALRYE